MSKSSSARVTTKEPVVQLNSGEGSKPASIDDHQTTTEVNLTRCYSVSYEKKGDQHGVTYQTSNNKQEWTPVVRKCRKHHVVHRQPAVGSPTRSDNHDSESNTDSSDSGDVSPLCIPPLAQVEYVEIDGTPGLCIRMTCTRSWTPIAARTRLQSKNKNLHDWLGYVLSIRCTSYSCIHC